MITPLRRGALAVLAMGVLAWGLSRLDWSAGVGNPGPTPASSRSSSGPVSDAAPVAQADAPASPRSADLAEAPAAGRPASAASAAGMAAALASGAALARVIAASAPPSGQRAAVVAAAASGASAARSAAAPASAASTPPVVAAAASPAASAASGTSVARAPRTVDCAELARQLPNLTEALCRDAQLQASGFSSVEGVPLYQRDVIAPPDEAAAATVGPKPPRRPRVLVIGAIHGDEISSTSLVFHWIAHAKDTGADMDWRFIPMLNPDGLLQRRPTRTNARGVDLNRNFPTPNWDKEALQYWTKRTKQDSRRYPGPEAASEPETRFIQHTMKRWKPDVVVSIHAPFGVLDYDGPSTPPERLGRLFLDRVGIYPGSLGNYGGVHRGVPVVTIELPNAIRTPTDTEMRQMWIDLLRWIGERLTPVER